MKRIAIVTTHPIQYNAPLFQLLAKQKEFTIKVFYTWSQRQSDFFDSNFGKNIQWDIPLLSDYEYIFVTNKANKPGNHHFMGIKCPTLIDEIDKWQASHLLIFGWNFHAHFKTMRHFKGKIPVWFRGDSHLLDEKKYIKTVMRRFILTWVYRFIDKALYVGHHNKNYFLAHGLTETQLVFVPHSIDNFRFDNNENDIDAQKWRKNLEILPNDYVILFCGKFETKKNPLLLLNSFVELSDGNENLKLIFVGNGKLEDLLKEKARENSGVIFLPFQNQTLMPIVYRLADLFCLPSQGPGETWGLAVNEALACGVPVLVSDKVGCAIDLVNDKNGIVFKSNDSDSLKNAINELSFRKFGKKEIQNTIKEYSYNTIINSIKKLSVD